MKSALKHSGNNLIYYWRESIGTALFISVFALIWNGVVLGALYATITGDGLSVDDVPYTSIADAYAQHPVIIIFLLFPIIGLGAAYFALCFWLNKTTFSYDGFYLLKKTGPLPFKGDLKLSRSTIVKVYVKLVPAAKTRNVAESFNVIASTIDGREIAILNLGLRLQDATTLENWIKEKFNL